MAGVGVFGRAVRSVVPGARSTPRLDVLMAGFVGGTGGASTLMVRLSRALTGRGLRTGLAVPDFDSTEVLARRCAEDGVAVVRTGGLAASYRTRPESIHRIAAASSFLLRQDASLIHYHISDHVMPLAFVRALRLTRVPAAVATMHKAADSLERPTAESRAWAGLVPKRIAKVISVSRRNREQQLEFGVPDEHVTVIHNGISADAVAGDGMRARSALGIGEAEPIVLFLARMAPEKRPVDLLEAFARLAPGMPAAHLVYAGTGVLDAELRQAAQRAAGVEGRVHVLGHRYDVADLLNAATVWVLPTSREAFSVGVLEAMAAGCPIISTRIPGNEELLWDGENALLVPVGDVDALAAALGRVLQDPSLRQRLSAAGCETAAHFSEDRMVDAHIRTYQEVLSVRGGPTWAAA